MEELKDRILKIKIEDEMKSAYIDYSMSVIVSRALPDVRDGLKPVHRRILFAMFELGLLSNRSYKKSARIVGEVLGKYHPHGDSSVYDAMVRMAQDWSMRYTLVDGQGNFGSIDDDPPAAMRYTEARLRRISEEMLADINKETVDFQLNFDDTIKEPTVLPTRIPELLVNGASGIAVGMATNMPPHNLSEVIDGTIAYIDNREIEIGELCQFIKAPDFPTGGIIYGYDGVRQAFETGRGRILLRAKAEIEEMKDRSRILVTEIPYQVNKADLIARTAELVNEKKIEGISDIRDESDRHGLRIVYELKRDANASVILNLLYKYTALQTSFNVNNVALVDGRPKLLNIKELIHYFIEHRHDVVIRRTEYELREAEKKAHILEGLIIALDHLDEVIKLIRNSKTPQEAKDGLMTSFSLSEIQAKAILDMRLQKLTGLEQEKIKEEHAELLKFIEYLKSILGDEVLRMDIIKDELLEIKERYGDEPKSDIVYTADDFNIEDTIPNDEVVITISHMGYVKRTLLSEYKRQNRGGRGSRGTSARNEDFIEYLFVASMHNYILFFTEQGKCYWKRVFEIPEGSKTSKGRALQNLINIDKEDTIKAFISVKSLTDEAYINSNYIVLCTRNGILKKTSLEQFSRPRQNGINAITIREGDILLEAKMTNGNNEIMIAKNTGNAIRFPENKIRPMGRTAGGVKGINIADKNEFVIGMICIENIDVENVLVVSENGYGKRSHLDEYRITNRGGKGVRSINVTDKTGELVSIKNVTDEEDLMIVTKNGIIIRLAIVDLRLMGRATQGVRLIKLHNDDAIASVTKVAADNQEEEEEGMEDNMSEEHTDASDVTDETNDNVSENNADDVQE